MNATKLNNMEVPLRSRYTQSASHGSSILTSQLPILRWHEQIGDPTLADGILDRLVHNAHRIEMRGDSNAQKSGEAELIGQ
jgi:DNA replication protein DnaC